MNVVERGLAKLAWGRAVKAAPWLKTWSPIIGGLLLIVVAVLHFVGQHDAARTIMALLSLLALDQGAPIDAGQAAEAVAAAAGAGALLFGIVRKFIAAARKARASAR